MLTVAYGVDNSLLDSESTASLASSNVHNLLRPPMAGRKPWKPSTSFVGLSVDNQIEILSLLDALDILALRKCCRVLMEASKRRIIWINILRRAVSQQGVFQPTFPVERMTLPQLEHAATASYRFLCQIRRTGKQGYLQPLATRVLKAPSDTRDRVTFRQSLIIPGGRFLLTESSDDLLQLWDLGFHADTVIDPSPIASVKIHPSAGDYYPTTHPTADGQGLVIRVLSMSNQEFPTMNIFEIYPLAPGNRAFTHIGTYACHAALEPHEMEPYLLTSDLLVFRLLLCLVVWDFRRDMAATIACEQDADEILLAVPHLIVLDLTGANIYRIPPLQARTDSNGDPTGTDLFDPHFGSVMRIDYGSSAGVVNPYLDHWSSVLSADHGRRDFFFIYVPPSGEPRKVLRYTLTNIQNPPTDGLPQCVPVFMDAFALPPDDRSGVFGSPSSFVSEHSGDIYLQMIHSHEYDTMEAHVLPKPQVKGSEVLCSQIRLPAPSCRAIPVSTMFCPFSARLCIHATDGDIHVCDLVSPSPSATILSEA
ncbi:hypothetical protein PLICRDRAFT_42154 [Plicaturopsis crispa FD-325 SS-3]|nr:hypothetical protein PLICRDRAFT_42154 [Plicaturopsis crispa FD-325 SS-3]